MGEYGYTYESYSTSNTLRPKTEEASEASIRKPFVPFVPNSKRNPQEYVTRKAYPTTTRDDRSSDNYYYCGNGYDDKQRHRPIGSTIRDDNYDDRYPPSQNYNSFEPNRASGNGWSRPNASPTWSSFYDRSQLSKPTNDIGKTLGLLKEIAKVKGYGNNKGIRPKDDEVDRPNPSIWAEPTETDNHYTEPVDTTNDATRRYGIFNFKSKAQDKYN